MEHSQSFVLALITVLFCACVTLALPAGRSAEDVRGELSSLVRLFDKLKSLDSQRADDWRVQNGDDTEADSLSAGPALPALPAGDTLTAFKQGFLGVNKRQGAWSYDYGLGGGRFGKRYYGDYGIGGGRFGRDVDHVDVADSNDASL